MRLERHSGIIEKTLILAALAATFAGCGDVTLGGLNGSDPLLATSLSSGDSHTCAVSGGHVKCWGKGSSGQLGNGFSVDSRVPVLVTGLPALAVQVASGGKHTCALLDNGEVWCWGDNSDGQLGNSTFTGSSSPVQTTGITTATSLSAGANHTCALLADGSLRCWGNNLRGQLGNNSSTDSNLPVAVLNLTLPVLAVAAGGTHTCAILSDRTVTCWGFNDFEQLGNSSLSIGATSRVPVVVTNVSGAQSITSGSNHSCATVNVPSTSIVCWGNNASGQLGKQWTEIAFPFIFEKTSNDALTVNNITSPLGSISAGSEHTCAVLTDGTINCWGENSSGQLGNGTIIGFTPPGVDASSSSTVFPVPVSGVASATQVSSGLFHTCAIDSGRVLCWGYNASGQLGDGTLSNALTPVQVGDVASSSLR